MFGKKSKLSEAMDSFDEYEEDEIIPDESGDDSYLLVFPELLIGITVISLITGVIVFFLPGDRAYHMIGFIIGVFLAYFMVWHMNYTSGVAVMYNEDSVRNYIIKHYAIRMLVVLVTMVATLLTNVGDVVLVLIGIMSLKVSVYLQPFTDIILKKILKKGG